MASAYVLTRYAEGLPWRCTVFVTNRENWNEPLGRMHGGSVMHQNSRHVLDLPHRRNIVCNLSLYVITLNRTILSLNRVSRLCSISYLPHKVDEVVVNNSEDLKVDASRSINTTISKKA